MIEQRTLTPGKGEIFPLVANGETIQNRPKAMWLLALGLFSRLSKYFEEFENSASIAPNLGKIKGQQHNETAEHKGAQMTITRSKKLTLASGKTVSFTQHDATLGSKTYWSDNYSETAIERRSGWYAAQILVEANKESIAASLKILEAQLSNLSDDAAADPSNFAISGEFERINSLLLNVIYRTN